MNFARSVHSIWTSFVLIYYMSVGGCSSNCIFLRQQHANMQSFWNFRIARTICLLLPLMLPGPGCQKRWKERGKACRSRRRCDDGWVSFVALQASAALLSQTSCGKEQSLSWVCDNMIWRAYTRASHGLKSKVPRFLWRSIYNVCDRAASASIRSAWIIWKLHQVIHSVMLIQCCARTL